MVLVRRAVVADGANPVGLLQKLIAVGLDGTPEIRYRLVVDDEFGGGWVFGGDDTDDGVGDADGVGDVDEGLAVLLKGFDRYLFPVMD